MDWSGVHLMLIYLIQDIWAQDQDEIKTYDFETEIRLRFSQFFLTLTFLQDPNIQFSVRDEDQDYIHLRKRLK